MSDMQSLDDMTEVELQDLFNQIAKRVKSMLPPETGFIVIATPHGLDGGITQYVSNVQREDAAAWMREVLQRWEAGDYVPRD